jgi:hypothetical protein
VRVVQVKIVFFVIAKLVSKIEASGLTFRNINLTEMGKKCRFLVDICATDKKSTDFSPLLPKRAAVRRNGN